MSRTLKDYPGISLEYEDLASPIDFVKIFGRNGPVHIEIGSGKGTFLVNQAKTQPEVNFLGIEWANKYYRHAVDRIGRHDIMNVKLIRSEAASFLAEFVPRSSIDSFHIYFPDPWPKKRHNKRRLICQANIEQFIRCLVNKGKIRIATDHADYFKQVQKIIHLQKERLKEIEFHPAAAAQQGEWVGTNFERKYLKDKKSIFCIAVEKIQ